MLFRMNRKAVIVLKTILLVIFFGMEKRKRNMKFHSIVRTIEMGVTNARRSVCRGIVHVVCAVEGARMGISITVKFGFLGFMVAGAHRFVSNNESIISVDVDCHNGLVDVLSTALHECRHAWQHRYNPTILENYSTCDESYYTHPCEVDARAYATAVVGKLFAVKRVVSVAIVSLMVMAMTGVHHGTTVVDAAYDMPNHTVTYTLSDSSTVTSMHDMSTSDIEAYAAWCDGVAQQYGK